jgi:hypothetical protein
VLVMTGGRITGELPIEQCTEAGLGCLMGDAAPDGAGAPTPEAASAR